MSPEQLGINPTACFDHTRAINLPLCEKQTPLTNYCAPLLDMNNLFCGSLIKLILYSLVGVRKNELRSSKPEVQDKSYLKHLQQ